MLHIQIILQIIYKPLPRRLLRTLTCFQKAVDNLFWHPVIYHSHNVSCQLHLIEDYYCFNVNAFRIQQENGIWNQRTRFDVKEFAFCLGLLSQIIYWPNRCSWLIFRFKLIKATYLLLNSTYENTSTYVLNLNVYKHH